MGYPGPPPRPRSFDPGKPTIEIVVRPVRRLFRDGWQWTVRERYLFSHEGWRDPSGFCKYEADAWVKARAVVDRVRARYAARQVEAMRTRKERVPL